MTGFRSLWRGRRRGASGAVVAILTLTIAVAAAVLDLADGALWQLPNLPQARQLMAVHHLAPYGDSPYAGPATMSAWERAHIPGLELGGFENDSELVKSGGFVGMADVVGLTLGTLHLLRVRPAVGRPFSSRDEHDGSVPVVLLSQQLFQQTLGGDRALVGRARVNLGGVECRVIGVMPGMYHVPTSDYLPSQAEAWVPLPLLGRMNGWPGPTSVVALARTAPGVNLTALAGKLYILARATLEGRYIRNETLLPVLAAESMYVRPEIEILLAGGAVVLLLGFLNAACLLGAAGMERREERAIRVALGASPGRLRRQSAAEGALLGLLGGAAGVGVAALSGHALARLGSFYLHSPAGAAPDARVLAAMLAAAAALGALAGAYSGGSKAVQARGGRLRLGALATAEIALSVALVFVAGLVTASFVHLVNVPLGYSTQGVVYTRLMARQPKKGAPAAAAESDAQVVALLSSMRQQPTLGEVAVSNAAPALADWYAQAVAGWQPLTRVSPRRRVWFATRGYFSLLRMPVLEGSLERYRLGSNAVVVDQAAARQLFGTVDAVGRPMTWGNTGHENRSVVAAVVGNIREGRTERARPHIYTARPPVFSGYWTLLARARGPAAPGLAALGQVAASAPLPAAAHAMGTLAGRLDPRVERFRTSLALTFALLALAIGLTGVFACMARRVTERRRELAIRLALGDSPGGLFARVIRDTAALGLAGALAGLLAAWWAGGAIRGLLFEVAPNDGRLLAAAGVLMLAAAVAAGVIPALRAARTDPNQLLRDA
ncbi:MAG: FtsX-like permease family protein [Terriglobales bacterium]